MQETHQHFWSPAQVKDLLRTLGMAKDLHPLLIEMCVQRQGDYEGYEWRRATDGWVLTSGADITWKGWTGWSPFQSRDGSYLQAPCPFTRMPRSL